MTQSTPLTIKLIEARPDKTENVRSVFTGDADLRNEAAFYIPGEDNKWTKYLKVNSTFRATSDAIELAIFIAPQKVNLGTRMRRNLSSRSDDAQFGVFLALSLAALGLLVAFFLFTDPILGTMMKWVGAVLGLSVFVALSARAINTGWPPLFGSFPAALLGFAVFIATNAALDLGLEPPSGVWGTPSAELGALLRDQIGALPAIVISYSSTILVILRALGLTFAADLMATFVDKFKKDDTA
mgnify:CR=1 FL=1